MQELIDPNRGIQQWKYVFPETGFTVTASNFNALVTRAMTHATANDLNTTSLVSLIENYICLNSPEALCHEVGSPRVNREQANPTCGSCGSRKAK